MCDQSANRPPRLQRDRSRPGPQPAWVAALVCLGLSAALSGCWGGGEDKDNGSAGGSGAGDRAGIPASEIEPVPVEWESQWARHTAGDVKSTNPLMMSSTAEFDVVGLTGISLLTFDWEMNPFGDATHIESWQTSQDGLYDKVILRDDLTWSDGHPLTAHDIEFSFQVIMSEKVPVPAVRSGTDQLKGVKAYDDHTVVFFHKESLATNSWNILFPFIAKHIYEESIARDPTMQQSPYHVKLDENPISSGPYVIASRKRGQEIILQRREQYYRPDAKPATAAVKPAEASRGNIDENFELGDLVESFEPPSLDELEQAVQWRDRPVLDAFALLTDHWAERPSPMTVSQALQMKNDSPEKNVAIRDTLGRYNPVLDSSEDHIRPRPYFKTIRMKIIQDPNTALLALKKGDIEEMQLTPEQWQTQTNKSDFHSNNTKAYDVEWVYFYFGWNCEDPRFEDKRVRQAMSYAFDHEEMIEIHRFGLDEPSQGIFHPDSKWFPEDAAPPYKRDRAKAQELLTAAGWTDSDGDGTLDKEVDGQRIPFEFTMIVSNRQDRIDLCNLLRENLGQIGITCKVRPMEFTVLQQMSRDHQFQAIMAGWGTGTDPDTADNLWKTDAGRNYVQYSNPEVDRLFEEGKRELDPEKRARIYGKIHKILYEDQPYTWLYFQNSYYAFDKQLRGYKFSPRGPYNYSPGQMSIFKAAQTQ